MGQESDQETEASARGFGLAITNLTKLGGAAVAINELLVRAEFRQEALAVAALMIAGAQGVESILRAVLGSK